ncbi:hypothetical protein GALMADRAFT_145545 [Galerina marginata CBS 339.88]|uniref:Uncharacterized protein n=1 Tax=Galerina marginata (strain CBS 339.88) TaxID=685588 RepID=A0A067SF12_GALM3|nr:hypothetical protein GALMADRAFT_145545 [Galerina marginata CBS 339.88]
MRFTKALRIINHRPRHIVCRPELPTNRAQLKSKRKAVPCLKLHDIRFQEDDLKAPHLAIFFPVQSLHLEDVNSNFIEAFFKTAVLFPDLARPLHSTDAIGSSDRANATADSQTINVDAISMRQAASLLPISLRLRPCLRPTKTKEVDASMHPPQPQGQVFPTTRIARRQEPEQVVVLLSDALKGQDDHPTRSIASEANYPDIQPSSNPHPPPRPHPHPCHCSISNLFTQSSSSTHSLIESFSRSAPSPAAGPAAAAQGRQEIMVLLSSPRPLLLVLHLPLRMLRREMGRLPKAPAYPAPGASPSVVSLGQGTSKEGGVHLFLCLRRVFLALALRMRSGINWVNKIGRIRIRIPHHNDFLNINISFSFSINNHDLFDPNPPPPQTQEHAVFTVLNRRQAAFISTHTTCLSNILFLLCLWFLFRFSFRFLFRLERQHECKRERERVETGEQRELCKKGMKTPKSPRSRNQER